MPGELERVRYHHTAKSPRHAKAKHRQHARPGAKAKHQAHQHHKPHHGMSHQQQAGQGGTGHPYGQRGKPKGGHP